MFEITENELDDMVSQSLIPDQKSFGGAKAFAFTEQGIARSIANICWRSYVALDISEYLNQVDLLRTTLPPVPQIEYLPYFRQLNTN